MAIGRFKDLCIDSGGGEVLGRFWAAALGLEFEPDDDAGTLTGDTPEKRVWMNTVFEPKTVKHRVHLDVHTDAVEALVGLGATVVEPGAELGRGWTVLADPEGGELCAFVRQPESLPSYRLYELVVDSVAPKVTAAWWADVLDAELGGRADKDWWWLDDVPGLPFDDWVFVPVPEPKTVKNRIHWDISVDSLDDLVSAGATLLRAAGDEIGWNIMADPEGNEFCAFVSEPDES